MSSIFDFQDGQGLVPAHQHINPDGSTGGWVADTATVANTATIGPYAQVSDHARVLGFAQISGKARVSDYTLVRGYAVVSGDNQVSISSLPRRLLAREARNWIYHRGGEKDPLFLVTLNKIISLMGEHEEPTLVGEVLDIVYPPLLSRASRNRALLRLRKKIAVVFPRLRLHVHFAKYYGRERSIFFILKPSQSINHTPDLDALILSGQLITPVYGYLTLD